MGGGGTPRLTRLVPILRPFDIVTLYTQFKGQDLKRKKLLANLQILVNFGGYLGPPAGRRAPLG